MKRITGLLLLILLGSFVCAGSAEESFYRKDYFEETVHEHRRAARGISSNIEENISDAGWGCLDFQVTKAIADEKETIVEIVAILNDPDSEIRIWRDGPSLSRVTDLEIDEQHTIYYINANYAESCDAMDYYGFDRGVCFILYGSSLDIQDGVISKEIVISIGIVNKDGKRVEEVILPIHYRLRPFYDYCSYDLSSEPLTEEIRITKLELVMTILRQYDVFKYEPVSKDYRAELDYDKPRISIPEDPIPLKIYEKGQLIKVIEFIRENDQLIPWRYWTPQMYE